MTKRQDKQIETGATDETVDRKRRGLLKKLAYATPAIVALNLPGQALGQLTPPQPPANNTPTGFSA